MRMYHPKLAYTKENGGVEVTDEQFRLAWKPKGWRKMPKQYLVGERGPEMFVKDAE